MKTQSLTPTDWIRAGFRALTQGGPQAIRAEALARSLKVSKGSFYWHFKDVAALKTAMIEHWQQAATHAVIAALDGAPASARDRLAQLISIVTDDRKAAYGGPLVEAAIRDWGRYDAGVQGAVQRIDTARLDYVTSLFCEHGFEADVAHIRAKTLYAALIGLEQLSTLKDVSVGADLEAVLDMLLLSPPKR